MVRVVRSWWGSGFGIMGLLLLVFLLAGLDLAFFFPSGIVIWALNDIGAWIFLAFQSAKNISCSNEFIILKHSENT